MRIGIVCKPPADGFFGYDVSALPAPAGFTVAPWLDNNNAASVAATLAAAQASGLPLAVKVREPLTNPAALHIDSRSAMSSPNSPPVRRPSSPRAASRTRCSAPLAARTPSSGTSTPTRTPRSILAADIVQRIAAAAFQAPGSNANYTDARGQIGSTLGNQIAMPSLMPSSPDFRTPAAGNSNAPNIRAALFTLPIVRLTYAELGLRGYNSMPTGAAAHSVPGTPLADARLVPTVRASTTTGIPRSIATATPRTATPMCKTPPIPPLSRGDFSAQVLHYRLRGANSVNLFGGASVVGYGAAAAQEDIRAGWSASSRVNEIFASGGDRGGLPEDRGLHARD